MIWQFFSWYLVIQLITVAVLPLTLTIFTNLPDRGYAFAKSLGILLVGFIFWLGYSYGLLRNELGGAWLALLILAVLSASAGRRIWHEISEGHSPVHLRYVLLVELLFLATFGFWAYVRAHDPAVDHTEEPMDLMFMNSIWTSPTFPPHDAWLGGYAISYYYFGYWLLTTIGRLAGQLPEIAYTLGQASWYGLLWTGCFGLVYNLLVTRDGNGRLASLGGLLGAVTVAFAGNLQGLMEWLYANGINVTGLARLFNVANFPENAAQTGDWFIGLDWWWWRSSRVISDRFLNGDHMEVIDEFPIFSYVLGDNHPHVTAMPIVILVIALTLNLLLSRRRVAIGVAVAGQSLEWLPPMLRSRVALNEFINSAIPSGKWGFLVIMIAMGSLIGLNTWDLPAYWLLFLLALGVRVWRDLGAHPTLTRWQRWGETALLVLGVGMAILLGVWLLYYPYFLTAQSQASGVVPNLFNPTRFAQFFVMFSYALMALLAIFGLLWERLGTASTDSEGRSTYRTLGLSAVLVYGLPLLFLAVTGFFATGTARGRAMLDALQLRLPEGSSYGALFAQRWGAQFWTFLVVGAFLAVALWLLWQYLHQFFGGAEGIAATNKLLDDDKQRQQYADLFVLLLATVGLLLVFAPEFVYLRDNFGTRMNTVFKFYYQAWLLFGLSAGYVIIAVVSRRQRFGGGLKAGTFGAAILSLLLIGCGLIYGVTATYSKAGGFAKADPTFDSTAYLRDYGPAELAAIQWVRANTALDALVVEGQGASYYSNYNRMSTITGRQTLLGWDGHEGQWRGKAYGEMAQGRDQALNTIYRGSTVEQITQVLDQWQIDYVYVGPAERSRYEITPAVESNLAAAMELAFESGDVRIYARRR